MKRLFLILLLFCPIYISAQDVMVTSYKDGHVRTDKIEDVAEISFLDYETASEMVPSNINRGLLAYYTFDSANGNDCFNVFNGFVNGGSFINDTPNKTGKALRLGKGNFMDIPSSPLDGKQNYSVNFWIKDFGSGPILSSQGDRRLWGPTLYITDEGKLFYYAGCSSAFGSDITFSADLSAFMSEQWVMLTIVTTSEKISTLYINGRKAASGTVSSGLNTGAVSMTIGGTTNYTSSPVSSAWADPMKIDNVRLYSVALSEEEVQMIYEREQHPEYMKITPDELVFNANTSSLSFEIENKIGGVMPFRISDETGMLSISPQIGEVAAFGNQEIIVSIENRDEIESFYMTNIVVSIADIKYVIPVTIDRANRFKQKNVVLRGLQAYYNFNDENADDVHNGYYPGTLVNGGFISDSPNGTGFALKLMKEEYMDIPSSPLDGKQNYSVNLWIKDFGSGPLLSSQGDRRLWGPTLYITDEGKLFYYAGCSSGFGSDITFSADLSTYQSEQWIMLTVVTTSDNISTLYINGRKAASGTVSSSLNTGASSMTIGGTTNYTSSPVSSAWADPMKIDNIRLYRVALSDEEISEIYYTESR